MIKPKKKSTLREQTEFAAHEERGGADPEGREGAGAIWEAFLPKEPRAGFQEHGGAGREHMLEAQNKELFRSNKALETHVAALDAANQELASYSHFVSHDLRVPLRFMGRIARQLLEAREALLHQGAVEQVRAIMLATEEMDKQLDQIVALLEVKRALPQKQVVDPRELFETALRELEFEEGRGRVEVRIEHLAPCTGDRTLLKEVAVNLLGNALKFTRMRNPARITIGCAPSEGETVYFVRDNGIGFEGGRGDSLFIPFCRLHKAIGFEGTGLGLALVRHIIERHGGRVWAQGETNKGAAFYFTLTGV